MALKAVPPSPQQRTQTLSRRIERTPCNRLLYLVHLGWVPSQLSLRRHPHWQYTASGALHRSGLESWHPPNSGKCHAWIQRNRLGVRFNVQISDQELTKATSWVEGTGFPCFVKTVANVLLRLLMPYLNSFQRCKNPQESWRAFSGTDPKGPNVSNRSAALN